MHKNFNNSFKRFKSSFSIDSKIIQAAKNGEIYHLWWHPHNFGIDTEGALKTLKAIVEVFVHCREVYGMESLTMKQLRDSRFDVE